MDVFLVQISKSSYINIHSLEQLSKLSLWLKQEKISANGLEKYILIQDYFSYITERVILLACILNENFRYAFRISRQKY